MKKLLFIFVMFGVVLFACDNKVEQHISQEVSQEASDKAQEIAENEKKEVAIGNNNKALKLFNESLKLHEVPWVFAERGKLKIDMNNDIEGAIVDLTKAIDAEKRGIYYIWRADAYRILGNDELANADIEEAGKLPKDY